MVFAGVQRGVIRNKSKIVSQSITPFLYRCCRFFTFNRKHLFLQMLTNVLPIPTIVTSMLTAAIPKALLIAAARKALMATAKTAQVTMKTVPLKFLTNGIS